MTMEFDTAQTPARPNRELVYIIGGLGGMVGAAFLFAVTGNVAAGLLLGGPIGVVVALIGFRTIPRIVRGPDPVAQANGAAPPPPTVEVIAKPVFRMKIKR